MSVRKSDITIPKTSYTVPSNIPHNIHYLNKKRKNPHPETATSKNTICFIRVNIKRRQKKSFWNIWYICDLTQTKTTQLTQRNRKRKDKKENKQGILQLRWWISLNYLFILK